MDPDSKWKLQSFIEELERGNDYAQVGFSIEELEENIDAWNKFFEKKGLSDPATIEVVRDIIGVVGHNIVYRSKDDQFYTRFYLDRHADNPPLLKKQLMQKSEDGQHEYWAGKYIAELASPEQWPDSVRDYTSCNIERYGIGVFEYEDPAKLGLTYFKISNFQIEAAKIALELVDYFEKLYGKPIPGSLVSVPITQSEQPMNSEDTVEQQPHESKSEIDETIERVNTELQQLYNLHCNWWNIRKKLYVSTHFVFTELDIPSDWKDFLSSELVDKALQEHIWKHFVSAANKVFDKEGFVESYSGIDTAVSRFKDFNNTRLLYKVNAEKVTSDEEKFCAAVNWEVF